MVDSFLFCLKKHQIRINFLLKNVDRTVVNWCVEKHCADFFHVLLPIYI